MRIEINAELPFSWCKSCTRRDLRTETLTADGEVYDSQTICENAPICEACEKARSAESETTLVIEPDESERTMPTEALLRMQAMIDRYRQKGRV